MELEHFIKKFADCFTTTPATDINNSTEFKKLEEWGSMMALIVIAMIDSDFKKTITAEDLRKAKTVEDLFEIVRKK